MYFMFHRNEAIDYLNSSDILQSNNIITIQCTSYPYSLLTEASRIPFNNIVSLKGNEENRVSTTQLPSKYFCKKIFAQSFAPQKTCDKAAFFSKLH